MTQGGPGPKGRPQTLEEPPADEIRALIENGVTTAYLMIKIHNIKGMGAIPSFEYPLEGLLTDDLANTLRETNGGGKYLIDPRDPVQRSVSLCTRFNVVVVAKGQSPHAPDTTMHTPLTSSLPTNHGYFQALRAGDGHMSGGGVKPSDVAAFRSDEIAVQTINDLREQSRKDKEKADIELKRQQREIERLTQQISEINLRAAQQHSDARFEALRGELLALRSQPPPPPPPKLDIGALAQVVAAIVPVVTALISSGQTKQQTVIDAQRHAAEKQFELLLSLLNKKPDDTSTKLITELLPKLLESRGGGLEKFADVISSMADSQLGQLHMAAQMMQTIMPEPDTPGVAFIKQLTEGVLGFVEHAQQASTAALQPPQQQRQLQHSQSPSQPPQVVASAPAGAVEAKRQPRVAAQAPKAQTPRDIARAIVADPNWPADMKTPEWVRLLTALHSNQDPKEIGDEIAVTLQGLFDVKKCAEYLLPMFEDGGPRPSDLLRPLFGMLPAGQPAHIARLNVILAQIDSNYTDDEQEESTEEGEEQEELQETEDEAESDQIAATPNGEDTHAGEEVNEEPAQPNA